MKENAVLEEIRAIRDEHARECGYDIHKLFRMLRDETEKLKAQGRNVVSSTRLQSPGYVREDPRS